MATFRRSNAYEAIGTSNTATASETKTVDFELNPSQFAARDEQNNAVVEAGKVQISIGGKQLDKEAIAVKKVVQAEVIVTGNRFVVSN